MTNKLKFLRILTFFLIPLLFLNSCGGLPKPGDARKVSPDPKERVKKNLEEGKGFRINTKKLGGSTNFEFASSNELWRASLDIIEFMPLTSANYSGGIIITDWYSTDNNPNETIKITIRFLSNEIRADAVDIKIFYKKCNNNSNCIVSEDNANKIVAELRKEILKKATIYQKQRKDKNFEPYMGGIKTGTGD